MKAETLPSDQVFSHSVFLGYLSKGKLDAAMNYLRQFPQQAPLYSRYASLFEEESYLSYDVDAELNEILLVYQKYYRDAFYLRLSPEEAARKLGGRLADVLGAEPELPLERLEEQAADAFRLRSLHVLTGRTSGWFGPYIWRDEALREYAVELPEGRRNYTVKFLDGFVMKSWLDYISFGASGTGGWSNGDGLIHCVKSSYDLDSENFRVSLLKHEAQHAADLERYPGISSEDLEYRAKLVELIYSRERPLLERFLLQADASLAGNGHALAAGRIVRGFEARLGRRLDGPLSPEEVRSVSLELFQASGKELAERYG